ncbi:MULTISPECIES: polynucleotide adenylyltransferase PcnB [unclassified Limnohabitans]|uniref:polynucleotide adenylyltransferase PcnB n=1 Tax=unclassified Limnohabitans TaxID=2626134 RepID=UPI000D3B1385|nr:MULTISPECIES: polynucleotide adenylyltransferase PcnB [unclassified Limnohabitans]PUE21682.1 poly(A) polymerase [Limnohabitans sp. MMS-10A-192]PUE26805.1 poly(A) polymerase [Limnohabitans sp. MMS-10A-160]
MIKKFITKLLGKPAGGNKPSFGRRTEVPASVHRIDPNLVDERAINVTRTLQQAGFEAYIVGGAVRDLLLGLRPKDFDVATDATPEQVKGLFRRAFIIGRRFRIVHVVYGRGRDNEVIEVSTFRAYLDNAAAEQVKGNERTSKRQLEGIQHAVDSSGRVLRDNVWGPQDEDATRRDFTVNAMYYDPETQIVVDYHGGIQDAKKHTLRMIGDPATRYREDPVRIIRAVRFAAKLSPLGFKLESKTAKPLVEAATLLADVPQSRLFDEMLKLLQTGHALASIAQLKHLGLAKGIYPLLDVVVERADSDFVKAALADTDRRVGEGKPVAPSFLLACVLWADVRDGWAARLARKEHPYPALQDAIDEVFDARIGDVSGRGKLAADMREIWMMQPRFEKRVGATPFSLVEQARFRAGFDFLRLRADAQEVDDTLADWWQEFSMASDAEREDLVQAAKAEQLAKPRVRRAPKPQGEGASPRAAAVKSAPESDADAPPSGDDSAPKKRRRRRRKPGSGGEPGAASAE